MTTGGVTYLAGIDGGGSGCRAAIADTCGRVLGRGMAGPANLTTDLLQAVYNARAALDEAAREAGLNGDALSEVVVHAGLAGMLDEATAQEVCDALPVRRATASGDRITTLKGALGNRDGVLAAIGTGSTFAAARGGNLRTLGGWGFIIGDQASGAWLGRTLLEQTLLCHDGLKVHSDLTEAVLGEFANDPAEMVRFAAGANPSDFAGYAPQIVAAATQGDAHASDLMHAGAAYLTRSCEALELGERDCFCLTGGIGPHYAQYLPEDVRARMGKAEGDALDGALRLAGEAAGQWSRSIT